MMLTEVVRTKKGVYIMWKESYRIGIESIDTQHQELFKMTDELLKSIEEERGPEAFQVSIRFLKDYVAEHFRDEEAYQASIQYEGMDAHIRQHREFTETVLKFEKKLQETSYDLTVVKELAGTLTAWLIYHVADADQKIVGNNMSQAEIVPDSYIDSFGDSVRQILEKMIGEELLNIHGEKNVFTEVENDVIVAVDLTGDSHNRAVFGFSKEFALKLFEAMTFMATEEVDEMVCSALAEMSNIICGNTAVLLSNKGVEIDIKTPELLPGTYTGAGEMEGIRVATDFGGLEVAIAINASRQR